MNKYQEALDKYGNHYWAWGNDERFQADLKTLQELVDRATPKKPIEVTTLIEGWKKDALKNGWIALNPKLCGNCKQETQWKRSVGENKWDYCPYCGQAIDWSKE